VNQAIALLLTAASLPLAAQWLDHRDPRIPRTKDGKPNLKAPAPRMNGKPDLSGLWQAERTPRDEFDQVLGNSFTALQIDYNVITKHVINVFWGLKPEEEPLRPEAATILKQRKEGTVGSPNSRCLPGSIPHSMFVLTFKMMQTPQEIVMLPESDRPRQIHTDGRSLPNDPLPSWMGYSVGKWEGDTLVVETNGLNEQAWLDASGHPRSESMRITERYRRRDFGHMDLEITFDDPKYYTRPFSIKAGLFLVPDSELLEYVCGENVKVRARLAN